MCGRPQNAIFVNEQIAFVAHWDWVLRHFRLPVAEALRKEGFDVTFICPSGRYVADLQHLGFRWLPWKIDRRSINPMVEARSVMDLTRIYRRERFRLAHHFTVKPNLYGTMAASRAEVPAVINTVSGLGFLFSEVRSARVLRRALRPLMRRNFRRQNVWTIFQNRGDRQVFVESGLANDPARIRLIEGTGVDLEIFHPPAERRLRDQPVVIMGSRLIKEKGVYDFAAAAEALPDCRFLLVGEVDKGNPSSIDDKVIHEWIERGVIEALGHRCDMDVLLRDADMAVLPTYYPEGVPRFLLEAAASGLPLVATDIPPCRAVVQDGVNGLLVPINDPARLARAIAALAADPELRSRFGSAGRKLVEEKFSQNKIVAEYLDLYRDVLSSS